MSTIIIITSVVFVRLGFIILNLFLGLKIYALTLMPLGAPEINMLGLFGTTIFISYCTVHTQVEAAMNAPKANKDTGKRIQDLLVRELLVTLVVLFLWGLAALIL